MPWIAEAEFATRRCVRTRDTEQFQTGDEADRNHRAALRIGHELPSLALELEPFPQAPPFQAVRVLDENGQDTRPLAGQAGGCESGKTPADGDRDLVLL